MFLKAIAQKNLYEVLEVFDDASQSFAGDTFLGRIDLTDRFLSIYNRPTRKRQLYTRPDTPLPASFIFRHKGSGDVYIVGQTRTDSRSDVSGGDPYIAITMLHLVTPNPNGSSGQAVHTRKQPLGPPDNPGWLQEVVLGTPFMDVEFRTSSSEAGVYDSKIENYYAWTPINVVAEQWDFFELNGIKYRNIDNFTDIGMRGLRLDREGDPRIDVVIHKSSRVYDPVEHAYVTTKVAFNVTMIVPEDTDIASWAAEKAASSVVLVVDRGHIGFAPTAGNEIEYQGRRRLVKNVTTQAGEKQYRLQCE